jgi:hypothetical protein
MTRDTRDIGRMMAQDGWTARADGFSKGTSQVKNRPPAPAPVSVKPATPPPAEPTKKQ